MVAMKRISASARHSHQDPAIFCDFDGTITTVESDCKLWRKLGITTLQRKLLNRAILDGKISKRHGYKLLIDEMSSRNTFEEAMELARETLVFDPGFRAFFNWCKASGIPVFVVSSGLTLVIRAALERFLGAKDASLIRIIANDISVDRNGRFSIVFIHPDSAHGHVKSRAMDDYRASRLRKFRRTPLCIFVGDGVSDTTAAASADLLLVKVSPKSSNDLATYCKREHLPFHPVSNFFQVLNSVGSLVERRTSIDDLLWESWLNGTEEKVDENGWAIVDAC